MSAAHAILIDGEWEISTTYTGRVSVARNELTRDADQYTGKSGWPLPVYALFSHAVGVEKEAVNLAVSYGGEHQIGKVRLRRRTRNA